MRYLAFDMGTVDVRVNAVSAGPLKTLAGVAAGVGEMQEFYGHVAPWVAVSPTKKSDAAALTC